MKLELLPRTDLTVRVIRALAAANGRRSAADLAPIVGSTVKYLPHVLRPLVRAGWVTSNRGPNGGYQLTRQNLTVLDVIELVEGNTDTGQCVLRNSACNAQSACSLHDAWTRAREALVSELAATPVLISRRVSS